MNNNLNETPSLACDLTAIPADVRVRIAGL